MKSKFALFILFAMIAGVGAGWASHEYLAAENLVTATMIFGLLTKIFITLIKMIIAPLVFGTLVVGIAHMGDTAALGRVGLKSVGWFLSASLMSLTLGLILSHILQPGAALNLALPPATETSGLDRSAFDVAQIITHIFPLENVDEDLLS